MSVLRCNRRKRSKRNTLPPLEGADIGISLILVFSKGNTYLVVEKKETSPAWGFPCGKLKDRDCAVSDVCSKTEGERFFNIARKCALNNLREVAGIFPENLSIIHQLEYVRRWTKTTYNPVEQRIMHEFVFSGTLKGEISLNGNRLRNCEYWDFEKIFMRALEPKGSPTKFDAAHALILIRVLEGILSKSKSEEDGKFDGFLNILKSLRAHNIRIDQLKGKFQSLILTNQN